MEPPPPGRVVGVCQDDPAFLADPAVIAEFKKAVGLNLIVLIGGDVRLGEETIAQHPSGDLSLQRGPGVSWTDDDSAGSNASWGHDFEGVDALDWDAPLGSADVVVGRQGAWPLYCLCTLCTWILQNVVFDFWGKLHRGCGVRCVRVHHIVAGAFRAPELIRRLNFPPPNKHLFFHKPLKH